MSGKEKAKSGFSGTQRDGPMSCTVYSRTVLISECKACPHQIPGCRRGKDIAKTFPAVPAGKPPAFALTAPPTANAGPEGLLPKPKGKPGPKPGPFAVSDALVGEKVRKDIESLYKGPEGSREVRTMERMPQLDKPDSADAVSTRSPAFYIIPASVNIGAVRNAKELKRWLEQRIEGSDPVRIIRGKELMVRKEVKTKITLSSLRQKKKGK